jgi:transcriptional regulator with XRE-family HTH domain
MAINRKESLQEIGKRLRRVRKQLNYSLERMAGKLGISQSGYYKNEGRITLPRLNTLYRLFNDFDISLDWLLFDQGPMHYKEKRPGIESADGKKKNGTLGLDDKSSEVRELLEAMDRDPLLRHELLVYFYKYKNKQGSQSVEELITNQ